MSEPEHISLRERFTRIEFVVVLFVLAVSGLVFFTAIPRMLAVGKREDP